MNGVSKKPRRLRRCFLLRETLWTTARETATTSRQAEIPTIRYIVLSPDVFTLSGSGVITSVGVKAMNNGGVSVVTVLEFIMASLLTLVLDE